MRNFTRVRCGLLALSLALMGGTIATAAKRPMTAHMEIQAEVTRSPELAALPSVFVDDIRSDVPLDDRFDADDVFDRPFVDSLRDGLRWYLRERGLRVVEAEADLRVVGVVISYEGHESFIAWGDSGVTFAVEFKFFHGHELVLRNQVRADLRYADEDDLEDEIEPKYRARKQRASFEEILFTRVGIDLGEELITLMTDGRAELERATGTSQQGRATPSGELQPVGHVTIDATVPHADVLIDGALVGTTPLDKLSLPEGEHVLEVRKEGYGSWTRQFRVLPGAATRFVAELTLQK